MEYTVNKKFRVREEKNGTYSFMNLETMQIMFLNKTASIVYNHDEINNLDELVAFMKNKYECPDVSIVLDDCRKVLFYMDCLGLIELIDCQLNKNNGITVAGEQDFKDISIFIEKSAHDKNMYVILNSNKKIEYTPYAIRSRQFNDFEYNFIHRDNQGIIDVLLTFSYNKGSSIFTLINLIGKIENENIIVDIIKYVFENTPFLTKIRFLIEDSKKLETIKFLIEKLQFKIEATLKKEFNENDLLIYSIVK